MSVATIAPPASRVAARSPEVELLGHAATSVAACGLDTWQPVATHSHLLRGGPRSGGEEAKATLLAWCRRHGVRAAGIGSPWEEHSAAHYRRYEGPDRDLYYSPGFDPQTVKDEAAVQACLAALNREAAGQTLFYLDNETPKARFGHLWWFGWHYDYPAWHDYSQDRPIQYFASDSHCELNARTGQPHRRRPYLEIVAAQRAHGALGIWAHPTSWWTGGEGQFVTNIASELPLHLLADGRVDGLVAMGYDACHRGYQELWFDFLDRGYRVPGFAESDACFGEAKVLSFPRAFLTYLPLDQDVTLPRIQQGARTGNVFLSTGGRLRLTVDGVGMGQVCPTAPDRRHTIRLDVFPPPGQERLGRVELLGPGGRVLWRRDQAEPGTYTFACPGRDRRGWLLARTFGQDDNPQARQQAIVDHTLGNPVYLRPATAGDPAPLLTELCLNVAAGSPWHGGQAVFESAAGEPLGRVALRGDLHEFLPANSRLRLIAPSGAQSVRYLAMENLRVQALLQYLHDGEFRRDHPGLTPGEVPVAAFRFDEMAAALARCDWQLEA